MNLQSGLDMLVFSSHQFDSEEVRTSALMKKFAKNKRVYFIEPAIIGVATHPTYFMKQSNHEVTIIQPYLPAETSVFEQKHDMLKILKELIEDEHISSYTAWTDTPKGMPFIRSLGPEVIVFDCQKDQPVKHPELELELLQYADIVLSGRQSEVEHLAL